MTRKVFRHKALELLDRRRIARDVSATYVHRSSLEPGLDHFRVADGVGIAAFGERKDVAIDDDEVGGLPDFDVLRMTRKEIDEVANF